MRIIVKNLPESAKKEEIEECFNKKGEITDIYMLKNVQGKFRRICFIGYKSENEAHESQKYFNQTYFKNHKIFVEIAKEDEKILKKQKNETQLRKALYSKIIVVKNLGDLITKEEIVESLENIGKIEDIKFEGKDDNRVAIIKFSQGEHAEKALKNVTCIAGRRVKIGNFKENIDDSVKEHYNTLFFNFDTVVNRICENERISKSALVDLSDKELGTKISLLESNLVNETKKFLERNNIFIDGIKKEKSKTTLILRNSDLLGVLDLIQGDFKVNIAPSKCLALLEFKDQKMAEKCYRELNMRRHKNQVIYFEFAPICSAPLNTVSAEESVRTEKLVNKIVVKNVPFQATKDELKKIFSTFTHVLDVRLPVKPDGKHRGFGFIVLDSAENVYKTIDYFGSSTHLYGRRLVLEPAKK